MFTTTQIAPKIGLKVVERSYNRKTGYTAGTYRITGPTCPKNCKFLTGEIRNNNGKVVKCYTEKFPISRHSAASDKNSDELGKLNHAPLVRHEMTGDSFKPTTDGRTVLDREHVRAKIDYHERHPNSIGWGYTHRSSAWDAADLGPEAWPENFETLASVDSITDKTAANAAGWRTARIIKSVADKTSDETVCPYDAMKAAGKDPTKSGINCSSCRKCLPGETYNIAFLPL